MEWKFSHCMMRKDENVDVVGTSKISAQVRLQHTDVFYLNVISYKGPGMGEYEN